MAATRFDPAGPLRGSLRPPARQVDLPPRRDPGRDGGGGDRGLAATWTRRTRARRSRRSPCWAHETSIAMEAIGELVGFGGSGSAAPLSGDDRRRERRDADAHAARMARRPAEGRMDARRRRLDPQAPRRPDRSIPWLKWAPSIRATDGRVPPLRVRGRTLHGITYRLPVASAQVKSCLLLAGLLAEGETTVIEPAPTRDHTERMLRAAGADVRRRACWHPRGAARPAARQPGDRAPRRAPRRRANWPCPPTSPRRRSSWRPPS